jgi:hypothetical protein
MLEFLYGTRNHPEAIPFFYDIISKETEIPLEVLDISPLTNQVNWFAIGLMSAGALLLSGSIFLSYYHGHP